MCCLCGLKHSLHPGPQFLHLKLYLLLYLCVSMCIQISYIILQEAQAKEEVKKDNSQEEQREQQPDSGTVLCRFCILYLKHNIFKVRRKMSYLDQYIIFSRLFRFSEPGRE